MSAPYGHPDDDRMSASEWLAYLRGLDDDELDSLARYGAMQRDRHDAQDERDRRKYEALDA
jgi:hypothetical protein